MSALAYCDALRSERLPANLIMAQRDYFGAHGYERVDEEGTFHTRWEDGFAGDRSAGPADNRQRKKEGGR
jgi:6-phosphogluconate dehydrogenase